MWSVVIESPTFTSTRAPPMSPGVSRAVTSWKNGGSWTYVDDASHSNIDPVGASRSRHRWSPSKIRPYSSSNSPDVMASAISAWTSSPDGQMSRRNTGPSSPCPSGSVVRSMSTRPASANATHSGGEAR